VTGIKLRLSDQTIEVQRGIIGYEVAKQVKSAHSPIAFKLGQQLYDLSSAVQEGGDFTFVFPEDPEGTEILRHSSAHLLAQAVKRLFPSAQVTIGPVIEDGFYYDFDYERAFTPEDLIAIEAEMQVIVKDKLPVKRLVVSRAQAIEKFKQIGEHFKVEIIQDLPDDEVISIYEQGEFFDLCRGPHVPNTRFLKAFQLTKVSGSYWRGDAKGKPLQRIYGTAFANKEALKAYFVRLEQAKARDHRLIAKKMHLFHIDPSAPGMVFWHPNGQMIYQLLMDYVGQLNRQQGYQVIQTPQVLDGDLWEKSGHKSKFSDDMFFLSSEGRDYALKPMSCPCHIKVFNQSLKSYRNLPVRYAEFGRVHRNEPSGTLQGLMRLRGFVQDDGHIFCLPSQITDEVRRFVEQVKTTYQAFGFDQFSMKLSTRPKVRVGDDAVWDQAESALQTALDQQDIAWELNPGEGAFYGPKVEFSLKDCLGRVWQCGTVQLDFLMPERLGASYVDEESQKKVPVMLHRAILGSLERFLGILLENTNGHLPFWLAPEQVMVMTIHPDHQNYAQAVVRKLRQIGIRVSLDDRPEKIGLKVRQATIRRVYYLVTIGQKEVEKQVVTIRDQQGDHQQISLDQWAEQLMSLKHPPGMVGPIS
jgi:threonyl-tRNA synthetase